MKSVSKKVSDFKENFLNLTEKESILDKKTCFEEINLEALEKLLKSDLLIETIYNPLANKIYQNEREQLKKYKSLIVDGIATVKYSKIKGSKYGRVNPDKACGLISLRRQIRQTLCKNIWVDIDIENCHPNILYQICKMNDLECSYLEKYIKNRNKYLLEVMETHKTDRELAKQLFIRILYFGTYTNWISDNGLEGKQIKFVDNFSKELKKIGEFIYNNNKDICKVVEKLKKSKNVDNYNKIGSVVSYYLQEIECRILETIYNYLCKNKIIENDNCVLCYDGIMIKKEKYDESILEQLNKLIKNTYNLDLKFTEKKMDEDYLDILDQHIITEEMKMKKELKNYVFNTYTKDKPFNINEFKRIFNEDLEKLEPLQYILYFKITNSFNYFNTYHMYLYLSSKLYMHDGDTIKDYRLEDKAFDDLYVTVSMTDSNDRDCSKEYKFINLYNRCQNKNTYSTLEFEPNSKEKTDKYNLFTGFKYDDPNMKSYDYSLFEIYIEHIDYICSGNKELVEYILNWMAHIIQKPEKKTDVCIVLYSETEGIGKNLTFDVFQELLSGYCAKFKNTEAITKRFNGEMMGKLFVIGDEIKARAKEVADELKDIITRTKEVVEMKGKDIINDMKDFKNYAFTTNNENVFRVSNTCRRFEMIECPLEKKPKEHYKKVASLVKDKEALKHLHYYFKHRDISNFDPTNIVMTEYKKNMILENLPAYLKYFKDRYNDISYKQGFKKLVRVKELYDNVIEYAKENKMIHTFSEKLFSMNVKKYFGDWSCLNQNKQSCLNFPFEDYDKVVDKIESIYVGKSS